MCPEKFLSIEQVRNIPNLLRKLQLYKVMVLDKEFKNVCAWKNVIQKSANLEKIEDNVTHDHSNRCCNKYKFKWFYEQN